MRVGLLVVRLGTLAPPQARLFVAKVAEEVGVSRCGGFLNVGTVLCGRSLQLERRL